MRKRELEIALRAAGKISPEKEFFLHGSQAIHAYCRRPPDVVLISQECDIYPKNFSGVANLLHAELGRGSSFARRHGFYIDVVAPEIADLPEGWEKRLKPLRFGAVTAFCVDVYDLAIAKLSAGRLKDLEFVASLIKQRVVVVPKLRGKIGRLTAEHERTHLHAQLFNVVESLK
jgi:hypothetical protein